MRKILLSLVGRRALTLHHGLSAINSSILSDFDYVLSRMGKAKIVVPIDNRLLESVDRYVRGERYEKGPGSSITWMTLRSGRSPKRVSKRRTRYGRNTGKRISAICRKELEGVVEGPDELIA